MTREDIGISKTWKATIGGGIAACMTAGIHLGTGPVALVCTLLGKPGMLVLDILPLALQLMDCQSAVAVEFGDPCMGPHLLKLGAFILSVLKAAVI